MVTELVVETVDIDIVARHSAGEKVDIAIIARRSGETLDIAMMARR